MLMNFTVGMFGAVVGFMWTLVSVIKAYQTGIVAAIGFFAFAALAAVSFGVTWLLALYAAATGTVYVGAKMLANNMRLQNSRGGGGGQVPQNIRYDRRY